MGWGFMLGGLAIWLLLAGKREKKVGCCSIFCFGCFFGLGLKWGLLGVVIYSSCVMVCGKGIKGLFVRWGGGR